MAPNNNPETVTTAATAPRTKRTIRRPPLPRVAPEGAHILTLPQASSMAQVSERTLRDLQRAGELELIRIGRCIRVSRSAIEDLIARNTTPGRFG